MLLKLGQYPNERCFPAVHKCKMLASHPRSFEPPYQCDDTDCLTCRGLAMGRQYINNCYMAQHRENSREDVQGMLDIRETKDKIVFRAYPLWDRVFGICT